MFRLKSLRIEAKRIRLSADGRVQGRKEAVAKMIRSLVKEVMRLHPCPGEGPQQIHQVDGVYSFQSLAGQVRHLHEETLMGKHLAVICPWSKVAALLLAAVLGATLLDEKPEGVVLEVVPR